MKPKSAQRSNARTSIIPVNCTDQEKADIEDAARRKGLATAAFLRLLGLQEAKRET